MNYDLQSINTVQDTTIRLRFTGGAWAFMTFQANPEKTWWNVVISSDWDSWSYGWTLSGMGQDIYSFMSSDRDYFKNKFTSGQKDHLYFDETIEKITALAVENGASEDLIDKLAAMDEVDSVETLYHALPAELHSVIQDWHDLSNCVVTGLKPRHKYFFDEIFPHFFPEIEKLKNTQQSKMEEIMIGHTT